MKATTLAAVQLRRLFRDRTNIFFVVVAPLLFLLVLGILFGGGQAPQLAVTGHDGGPLAQRLADALDEGDRVDVTRVDSVDALRSEVSRGTVNGGLVIPGDYGATLRAGESTTVEYLARESDPAALDLGVWVQSVVPQEGVLLRAAWFGADEGGRTFDEALAAADDSDVPGPEVDTVTAGQAAIPPDLGQFDLVAPSMLLLFVFLTSLTGALGMIESRRLGVPRRLLATPTRTATLVAGESLGRFLIALSQGLIVLVGGWLLFGVDWGDPVGAIALTGAFCLTGAGAAMLMGAVLRDEGPALGLSLALGLGAGAIGGAMMPLELLADPVQTVARVTPHSWGYEGFATLIRRGGTVVDILPELGVLTGFAAVLFTLGAWRLHRTLTDRPS